MREIGEAREIIQKYLLHKSGNPFEEALMLKELYDLGLTQKEIKELTGFSQPQISKRLRLLGLIPELQKRLMDGELKPSVAYELTKLSREKQREFAKRERIILKDVMEVVRREAITDEILDLVETPVLDNHDSVQYKLLKAQEILETVTGEKPVIVRSVEEFLKAVREGKKAIIFCDIPLKYQ